jgi:hypothetical protein
MQKATICLKKAKALALCDDEPENKNWQEFHREFFGVLRTRNPYSFQSMAGEQWPRFELERLVEGFDLTAE